MKNAFKLSVLSTIVTAALMQSVKADLHWDFSQPGASGYSQSVFKYTERGGGGMFNDSWDVVTGFTDEAGAFIEDGTLMTSAPSFAKIDLPGLAGYVGGSMQIKFTDSGTTEPYVAPDDMHDVAQYMFLTSTVGGKQVMLGCQVLLSSTNDLQLTLDRSNFQLIEEISYLKPGGPPTGDSYSPDIITGTMLSEEEFLEFLANCDALYFRMMNYKGIPPVGVDPETQHYTKISEISILQPASVPEPSTVSVGLFGLASLLIRRRR